MAPHHIWIECHQRPRLGEPFTATLGFGHGFVAQGRADPLRTLAWLVDPAGMRAPLAVSTGDGQTTLQFTPRGPGVYTLLCEYDGRIWSIGRDGRHLRGPRSEHLGVDIEKSIYSYQFAKSLIAVETDHPWPAPLGVELEIVPRTPGRKELEVAVLYKGHPLNQAPLQAFRPGDGSPHAALTDARGVARFPVVEGRWTILASHCDRQGAASGQYDERSLTSVLTLELPQLQNGSDVRFEVGIAEPSGPERVEGKGMG